jgi:hypothetical protein
MSASEPEHRAYSASMASGLSRPRLERPAPTHPLLTQLADSKAMIGVQGPEDVLSVVLAAYTTFAAGRDWDSTTEGGSRVAVPAAGLVDTDSS